ncbi:EF-hand calcium-binding domain-containing protein 6 isoform X2 [Mastomys coucha]|uniref:EF-hand calcium-binding domain-containing protein 6 isoform X2 n=1 Tax=Mastomys coucha TaxID=35658 RepID=UPI001262905D|nr:EF-hand calcium-binding domain-containing protein 6 isoform X2 [Mastomys coucha]
MRIMRCEWFLKQYNIDNTAAVDYNTFLKNFSVKNDLSFKYLLSNAELPRENQQGKNAKWPLDTVSSEDVWKNYSLDDLEKIFCQEFSKSYEKIEKALSAGDPSKGGYISLNYLKVVLDTFLYRLPRRVFIQLMRRLGLKTTTKVNWKQFLTTIYERQGSEVSKTIHLKKRGSTEARNRSRKENIIKKLFRYSEERYTALKKTLLITSSTPSRYITWEELRRILNCMVVKLSDSEFSELKQTFDPEGTGAVRVNSLLNVLDDSTKVRKMSPSRDTKTSLPVAWDSAEELVLDTITRNLQAFYGMLQSYDLGDTGTIAKNNFKKVMHAFCPYLSNEQLVKFSSKFQEAGSGMIPYKTLLINIGVGIPPPVRALSPPKGQLTDQFQTQQPCQQDERTQLLKDRTTEIKNMTKEEVIASLKHRIQQKDPVFRKQFLSISKEPDVKINQREFRKVLERSGMPMNDCQYAMLASKLGFKNEEGMSYQDFTMGFEDCLLSGLETVPLQSRTASRTNVDEHFISAEECVRIFPKKLKDSFRDAYSAFFRIDTDRDGIITMNDLHRLLQYLLLNMTDLEFERFLSLLGLRLSVTLNFREFQNLCEKRSWKSDEAPQRLIRCKQKVADSELACEQAHQYLIMKAKTRWTDLSKNFIETDNEGNGILRRRDIKNSLYGFDIPLTPREFEKLWQTYDIEGRGYITYQEFLHRLGIRYSPKVHRPYKEDYFNFLGHFTKPKQVQEEIQELQQISDREKLMDHYEEISKAFNAMEKSKPTALCRVQKVLQECGCPLKEEELISLLKSLDVSVHNNYIDPVDFLRALEITWASRTHPKEKEENLPVSFSRLTPDEVIKSMQEAVESSQPALVKAFSALDKEDTGFVKAMEFGDVLRSVCQKLTDNQYHYFLRKLRLHLTPNIHWKYFLENFSSFVDETADEWAENMPKILPPTSPKETSNRDILARLQKAVASHYHTIAQEFENFDTLKSNTVSRDEFRSICTHHIQILTDEQFDRLWSEMPVNAKGRLKYQDLLSKLSTESVPSAAPMAAGDSGESTMAQRGSSAPEVSQGARSTLCSPSRDSRAGLKSRSHPCTPVGTPPLQNCEPIESRLRKQIQGCWRELLKECKEKDTDKQGSILAAEFLALVDKFKLDISKEESQQLIVKYDLKNNGKFAYCDFIQSCVLLLKAKETSLMRRMRIQNADKMKEAGVETPSFYSALLRIQPKIVHCWRPMRRTFKTYDENGTGLLSVADFRKVLRQFSINLSEEEFFHVLEYYDKSLSSKISYNDFLRAFLQ